MKKKLCVFILCLMFLPLSLIFTGCNEQGSIQIRVNEEYVQWSENGNDWFNVISVSQIKEMLGDAYKGEQGEQGVAGPNGKEVEFRKTDTYIQWHYKGETAWYNLISINELKSSDSEGGTKDDANFQQLDFIPLEDGSAYGVSIGNAIRLTNITIPKTFNGKNVTTIIDFKGGSFSSITLPNTINCLENSAFENCINLKSVEIPIGVTSIGDSTFVNCSSLTSVTIPESVTSIGSSAFAGCRALTSVTIPSNVTSIGVDAFARCIGLTKVNITNLKAWCSIDFDVRGFASTNPLSYARSLYLNGLKLESITAEQLSGITEIKGLAFCGWDGTSIEIPESVTSIGGRAFRGCSSLTSIEIPESVTCISEMAFGGCTSLTKVNITDLKAWCNIDFSVMLNMRAPGGTSPLWYAHSLYLNGLKLESITAEQLSGITEIKGCVFSGWDGTSIEIPEGVTSIGSSAFVDCISLTSIKMPESITSIGDCVFEGCSGLTKVNITDLKAWCNIDFDVKFKSSPDGTNPLMYAHSLYLNGLKLESITAEQLSGITEIKGCVFSGWDGVSIEIPESITSIGGYAFRFCKNLTSATFAVTDGWYNNGNLVSSETLSNPQTAAKYLMKKELLMTRH